VRILALDTATSACSVAILGDGLEICRSTIMERGHAEALLPMVAELLTASGSAFADLDGLAVTVGPGPFTGLRTGLAAARGMALASRLPCLGVTTLEAVAEAVDPDQRVGRCLLVALDSRRRDIYGQVFDVDGRALTKPAAVSPESLAALVPWEPIVVAGSAAATAIQILAEAGIKADAVPATSIPIAVAVARISVRRWPGEGAKMPPPSPLYLRPPDTGKPKFPTKVGR
jgi:tRNA threonylcarbamoyladenosine biosynthesis protein TsaB